jgi:hypothetical protein
VCSTLDFGTGWTRLWHRAICSHCGKCTGPPDLPTSRVLADGNIRVDAGWAQAAASAPFTLPTGRREHTIPSGFTAGPVRGIPALACRAPTARFQSVRSARCAPGALHMIRYEVLALHHDSSHTRSVVASRRMPAHNRPTILVSSSHPAKPSIRKKRVRQTRNTFLSPVCRWQGAWWARRKLAGHCAGGGSDRLLRSDDPHGSPAGKRRLSGGP